MLMQNFKSATDLGLTEAQVSALQKTLVMLETGKLTHVPYDLSRQIDWEPTFSGQFNMAHWRNKSDCGTVCCIGGTACLIGKVTFPVADRSNDLNELFYAAEHNLSKITPTQAARALRNYLTTGKANWAEAVS